MGRLLQDLRFGLRVLAKSPGFTAVAVVTLALGIGANTAIFSLIDAVMLRSLPIKDPSQVVILQWAAHEHFVNGEYSSFGDCGETGYTGASGCSFPLPIFRAIRAQTNVFSGVMACAGPVGLDLGGTGPTGNIAGEIVSGDYFSTLGVSAFIGRTLGPRDDSPSAPPATVISYAFWQSAFGGKADVLGRTILLNKVPFTIVGVAQRSFTNLSPGKTQDLWLPIAMMPRLQIDWGSHTETMNNWWLLIIGRLKPGVSLGQAQAAASLVFRNEVLYGPKPYAKPANDPRIFVTRVQDTLVGQRGRFATVLFVLMFAVGTILLIACANVAGLLLSRATSRQKEVAVRLALGAGRTTILRQLLTESVLLSALGGIIGIVFAFWGLHVITTLVTGRSSSHFPYVVAPDWRVFAFAAAACVVTGLLFGLAPAFRSTRIDLTPTLKEIASSLPGGSAKAGFRLGNALVIAQVALSVVVLIGAGLLVRTFENLRSIDPGFDVHNLLLFEIDPGKLGYKDAQIHSVFSEMRDRLAAIPGVDSVAYSSVALLMGDEWGTTVHVEGQSPETQSHVYLIGAGPRFFRTMRIPLLEGRLFTPADFALAAAVAGAAKEPTNPSHAWASQSQGAAATAEPQTITYNVLVNETFVRTYFPKENPLGKEIAPGYVGSTRGGAWSTRSSKVWQIVGVIADTRYDTLRHTIRPVVVLPFTSSYGGYFELRTAGDPHALIPAVRSVAKAIDPNLPVSRITTQTQQIENLMSQETRIAQLSGFFAVLALVLACIGLYGLLSYEVSRRTREIGIRLALGAQRQDVLRLVVQRGLVLALVGIGFGIGVALGVTRYLAAMLYGVHANDPATMIVVAALLGAVAAAACYLPARRAINVDPIVALRYE